MNGPATRFLQRLDSYGRALAKLDELVGLLNRRPDFAIFDADETGLQVELAREALIKRFEFTQELSWNVLKDYLIYQGDTDVAGSRDVYRRALRLQLIDSPLWMQMILDRQSVVGDYLNAPVVEIVRRIISEYYSLFLRLKSVLASIAKTICSGFFEVEIYQGRVS